MQIKYRRWTDSEWLTPMKAPDGRLLIPMGGTTIEVALRGEFEEGDVILVGEIKITILGEPLEEASMDGTIYEVYPTEWTLGSGRRFHDFSSGAVLTSVKNGEWMAGER